MWDVINREGLEISIPKLPYPDCVVAYYKELGPDMLADLTGKSRKQIISTASRLGVSKNPRAKNRTPEERALALEKVREVHFIWSMSIQDKMAYVGAKSLSDYKHLARDAQASEAYVDIWEEYRPKLREAFTEAACQGLPPITYIKQHCPNLYHSLLVGPAKQDATKLRKAILDMTKTMEKNGEIRGVRNRDFWAMHKPRILEIMVEYDDCEDDISLVEFLNRTKYVNFYNTLLESKTESAIITAFRKFY